MFRVAEKVLISDSLGDWWVAYFFIDKVYVNGRFYKIAKNTRIKKRPNQIGRGNKEVSRE